MPIILHVAVRSMVVDGRNLSHGAWSMEDLGGGSMDATRLLVLARHASHWSCLPTPILNAYHPTQLSRQRQRILVYDG